MCIHMHACCRICIQNPKTTAKGEELGILSRVTNSSLKNSWGSGVVVLGESRGEGCHRVCLLKWPFPPGD